ncbi:MAG: hypothetical protein JW825_01975 [Candidatus Methanofastidiosa archaeon]|nr:hypothetical protein [Candidatus Methanofastidiosa archaeon]
MKDSNLAKFGDVLVNFLFSAAYLDSKGTYDGFKISNHVLMQALNTSKFKAPPRSDKHQRGDYVESIIASAWNDILSLDEMIAIISADIKGADMDTREASIDAQIHAISILLDRIHSLMAEDQKL